MQINCKSKNLEIKQMVFSQTKPEKQNRTVKESDILSRVVHGFQDFFYIFSREYC